VRTPVGRRGGGLADAHPADLGAHVIAALLARTGIDPAVGPQAGDIARTAWLAAGLPESVPGVTVDRQCGSSQQAVHFSAAALLIASERAVRVGRLTPRARITHLSVRGDDPVLMLTAPIAATAHALRRTGLTIDQIDLIEINEAFASVVPAWQRETGADLARVNASGGAIARGHPLGATGARLLTTLLHALERTGRRRGLLTMCEGGGQANVTIIERL